MSHEIDNSLGFDAFARVQGSDKAWHGLGQVVPADATLEDWQKASGTLWECQVIPSQFMFNGELKTSSNFHMVRSDTGASLGVMSERYKPVQPLQVWEFFKDFISSDDRFTLETGGALKGGKVIWALAKFAEQVKAGGDEHEMYTLLTTSFDGKLATTAQGTAIRVVCNNTLTGSLYDRDTPRITVRHCTKWTDAVKQDAHDKLADLAQGFERYRALGDALALQKMTKDATETFLQRVFLGPKADDETISTNAKNQLESLYEAYKETVREGTEVGTAWTALNAVTRFVDHGRTTRDHSGEGEASSRMSSAFFGSGAALKQRALDMLRDTLANPVANDPAPVAKARKKVAA